MKFYEFEIKYKDTLEKFEEWGGIRFNIGMIFKQNGKFELSRSKSSFVDRVKNFFNIFYGFKNWFKKYDYIVFSDSSQRKVINGKYFDKLFDDWIEQYSTLFIEVPVNYHYKNIYSKHIVSHDLIKIFIKFFSFFYTCKINNIDKIENILNKKSIEFDLKKSLSYLKSSEILYRLLLKFYKPKKIFLSCYYCKPGLVKVAKELSIKVVEFQHGIINEEHFGYCSEINISKKYLPDLLCTFGTEVLNVNNLLIKNIYPIGSFYIDFLKKNFEKNANLEEEKARYSYCIGFSMQDQVRWEFEQGVNFVNNLAKKNKDLLFILIPRRLKILQPLEKNVKVFENIDCYNLIMHCDVHCTFYSSCAIEAPSLGVPNILIDKYGFSVKYYKKNLNPLHTKIITKENEFKKTLLDLVTLNKELIMKNNLNNFVPYKKEKIKNYLLRENP